MSFTSKRPKNTSTYGPGLATFDDSFYRPRRPNPDTIQYLKSLPLDDRAELSEFSFRSNQASSTITNDNNDEDEGSEVFIAAQNALDEIKSELASLAGDEIGSQRLETIAKITCTRTKTSSSGSACTYTSILLTRTMLSGMLGYYRHLALNRYGSHVVQTLLKIAASQIRNSSVGTSTDNDDDNDTNDSVASLEDIILSIVEELSPYYYDLSIHVCGSHVLRSLLCLLAGVETIPGGSISEILNPVYNSRSSRGKKSKKKKALAVAASSSMVKEPDLVDVAIQSYKSTSSTPSSSVPNSFGLALKGLTERVMNTAVNNENHVLCHPSAGPLVTMLLQVLVLESFFQKYPHNSSEKIDRPKFSNDSTAEYLVTRMLEWDGTSKDVESSKKHIIALCMDYTASHFIEAVLNLANDNFYEKLVNEIFLGSIPDLCGSPLGNFVVQSILSNSRSKSQAEQLSKELLPIFDNLMKGGKQGVIWRLTEMAAKYRVSQESIHKKLSESIGKDSKISVSECIPKLVQFSAAEQERGRISLNANGCKIVLNLLRFVPRLCEPVLNGILGAFTGNELTAMAKDSLGSRCILDGILEGNTKDGVFQKALQHLLAKISEDRNWSNLAIDRVGQHVVKKLFDGLVSHNDKAILVAELAQSKAKLNGNNMGRSVLDACAVHEFLEGESQWKAKIEKIKKEKSILEDILMTGEDTQNEEGKTKRKRKRKAKESSIENEDAIRSVKNTINHDDEFSSGKTKIDTNAVADVLDLLSNKADKNSDKRRKRRKKKQKDD